jgi:hypothetical protein
VDCPSQSHRRLENYQNLNLELKDQISKKEEKDIPKTLKAYTEWVEGMDAHNRE